MIGLRPERLRTVALAGDALLALLAWAAAGQLRISVPLPLTAGLLPADRLALAPWTPAIGVLVLLVLLDLLGLYERSEPRPRLDLVVRLQAAVWSSAAALAVLLFVTGSIVPRSYLLLAVGLQSVLLPLWRLGLVRLWRPRPRRVLLVGSGATAVELAESIARGHWHGLEVCGHVEAPAEETPAPDPTALGPRLGSSADVPSIIRHQQIDEVIVAVAAPSWKTELVDRLSAHGSHQTGILLVPEPFESLIGRMRYRWVHDIPMIEVVRSGEWSPERPLKRVVDVVGASFLALVSAPICLAVAVAIRITSPGPAIYRQQRVGRHRRPFELLKFRTMVVDAEADGTERLASPGDGRFTAIGSWLRRTRLDELPQLLNVLRGDMSLVGPRPERPGFVARYLVEVPGYGVRFTVRPGLTGLAQVVGDYHTTAENKLRYELAYIANATLRLDLSILLRTVRTVLSTSGT